MPIRIRVLFAAFLILGFFACQKEKSLELGPYSAAKPGWEFKESGIQFKGPMDTAYFITQSGAKLLWLQGTSDDGTGDFLLVVGGPNDIKAGTYTSPSAILQYVKDGTTYYSVNPATPGKFTVTISRIDTAVVIGTFAGEVMDTASKTRMVVEGKFAAKLSASNAPGGTEGQLSFWASAGSGSASDIVVKIANQSDTISSFTSSAPACGASGTASFTLPTGNYAWKAYSGTDSAEGAVVVSNGVCSSVEVVFGAAPGASCKISNLGYFDLTGQPGLGAVTSFFDLNNKVTKVQLYDSLSSTIQAQFDLTYATGQVNVSSNQYFVLDAGGRIKEFHGFADPSDPSSPRIIYSYQFNASNQLIKTSIAFEAAPGQTVGQADYTWTNGNVTSITVSYTGSAEHSVFSYEYDTGKQAKAFLCLMPNAELNLFQSAVDYGSNSVNLITKSTITDYDANNNVVSTSIANFGDYVIDGNGYVKSFSITGDPTVYDSNVKYVLSYQCHN